MHLVMIGGSVIVADAYPSFSICGIPYYVSREVTHWRNLAHRTTGRLLGVQLFGHRHAEIAKRIDIAATAIFPAMTVNAASDLDLSCTRLSAAWDAIQMGIPPGSGAPGYLDGDVGGLDGGNCEHPWLQAELVGGFATEQ